MNRRQRRRRHLQRNQPRGGGPAWPTFRALTNTDADEMGILLGVDREEAEGLASYRSRLYRKAKEKPEAS